MSNGNMNQRDFRDNEDTSDEGIGQPKPIIWTLEQSVEFVRSLHDSLDEEGYTIALGGSCLHKGFSYKDVDIIIHPLDQHPDHSIGDTDFNPARKVLTNAGMSYLRRAKIEEYSQRCVELWLTSNNKRVDVFFMDA